MGNEVSWVLELSVKPGQLEAFRTLMTEMVESTKGEPGARAYEWFVSDDGSAVHIFESYDDSDAVMAHLGTFGSKFAERFLAAVAPTGFTVYGSPNEAVKAGLQGFNPTYLGPFGGFWR